VKHATARSVILRFHDEMCIVLLEWMPGSLNSGPLGAAANQHFRAALILSTGHASLLMGLLQFVPIGELHSPLVAIPLVGGAMIFYCNRIEKRFPSRSEYPDHVVDLPLTNDRNRKWIWRGLIVTYLLGSYVLMFALGNLGKLLFSR
jgi:hypothetical protein